MKVSDIGEFGLIASIASQLPQPDQNMLAGIGDDAAIWRSPSQATIAATDTLIEGVHFDLHYTTSYELGWKAMAANLSDIAAMGGAPLYVLLSLGLPGYVAADAVSEIVRGLTELGDMFGVSLVGGDTFASPQLTQISITAIGRTLQIPPTDVAPSPQPALFLSRQNARAGDLVAVTGHVGVSAAGLAMLRSGQPLAPSVESLLRQAHLKPLPRIKEGQALLRSGITTAMDISDGTAGDLAKICHASGVGARLWLDALPILPEVAASFPDRAKDFALGGGEDYELLFTGSQEHIDRARDIIAGETGTPITIIGEILPQPVGKVLIVDAAGHESQAKGEGYDHFAPDNKQ